MLQIEDRSPKIIDKFKYIFISSSGTIDSDVKNRCICLAAAAFEQFRNLIFSNQLLSLPTQIGMWCKKRFNRGRPVSDPVA